MVDIYEKVQKKCTGCAGCSNACPVNAITMQPDIDGFIMPVTNEKLCVDCNRCVNVCPVLNFKKTKTNDSEPKMYAARADDEIRAVSSSGGMFTPIANYVFERGGIVAGVRFEDDFSVSHTIICSPKELDKLRGSKYAQSDPKDIYRQVKKKLDKNVPVLFSGTPCQVAALKCFLGKEYEELVTVDLLCHGVQSDLMLKKYLTQKFKNKTPVVVKFRDKQFGWSAQHIYIKFSDGTDYHGTSKTDPYLKAFLKNLDLRKSCEYCPFSAFPRQGDISIGDFWGIARIDDTQSDKKGTSIMYVNNQKGRKVLEAIKGELTLKEFPMSTKVPNRIVLKMTPNVNRERFFKFMRNDRHTFEASVNMALSYKYDVGLVSNFYAGNFGGSLTQYALYNVMEDMGYNVLMIERPGDASGKANVKEIERIYVENPYKKYALSTQKKSKDDMRGLNNNCEMFVVGSDQLFQYSLYKSMGKFVNLDWVDGCKKKIAYAASFGHEYIWGDRRDLSEMAFFAQRFDAFSVREKSGVDIARDTLGIDAEFVLDPVFLCDKKHYDELIEKADNKLDKKYIASYILDPSEGKAEILKYAEKKRKMKACVFSEFYRLVEYTKPLEGLDVQELRVEERLKAIKNCELFITDSFHGTCFAIIMNKPFITIMNKNRGASRFVSLLSMFGLDDRLVKDIEDENWKELVDKPVDFGIVNNILNRERERCIGWLKNALEAEKKTDYSSYDVLIRRIVNQENEIKNLKEMLAAVMSAQGVGFSFINDPVIYFKQLAQNNKDKIVVATVKDTPGISVSNDVETAMKSAGFKKSIRNMHQNSYLCILDEGNVVYENISREEIVHRTTVGSTKIVAASRNMQVGNVSKNIINGKEYSVNRRGLNVTLIDKTTGKIIDSVCFDMHLAEYNCYRKSI